MDDGIVVDVDSETLENSNNSSTLKELYKLHDSGMFLHHFAILHPALQKPQILASIITNGQAWVRTLLASHPDRIRRKLGVRKKVFEQLVRDLAACGYTQSEGITLEEGLAIFLYTCTTGLSSKVIGELIDRPSATIAKCFRNILGAFLTSSLYTRYMKLPRSDDPTPALIANDGTLYPFFKDVIGAVDCMHLVCTPRLPAVDKRVFRNPRGSYSHRCLVCCNLNLEFTAVFGGWPGGGAANDNHAYCSERTTHFRIPTERYYLADVAFPACPQLLVPYSIQHHLPEWQRDEMRPGTDAHDYFNRRHAALRGTVERAIFLLKQRFRILRVPPDVEMQIQVQITNVLCCIHNAIRRWDPEDIDIDEDEIGQGTSHVVPIPRVSRKSKRRSAEIYGSVAEWGFVTVDERDAMIAKRKAFEGLS